MTDDSKTYFAVLTIGNDALGIVATLTSVLSERNCNIETSQMSIVGGHFSTTLIASTRSPIDYHELQACLVRAHQPATTWHVYVNPIAADEFQLFSPEASHSVTAESHDHPGVLHRIASVLSRNRVNITSLASASSEELDSRCLVSLDVQLPPAMNEIHLKEALERIKDLDVIDVDVMRRHSLTSQVPESAD